MKFDKIDIGQAIGVIILFWSLISLTGMILMPILTDSLFVDLTPIIGYFLGVGLYNHKNYARRWMIIICWIAIVALVLMTALSSFKPDGMTLRYFGKEISGENIVLWKVYIVCLVATFYAYLPIYLLNTDKAKCEFGISYN